MGLAFRVLRWLWRRISDATTASDVLDFLDLKTAIWGGVAGFLAMTWIAATNFDWSAPTVVLAALAGAVLLSTLALIVRNIVLSFRLGTVTTFPAHANKNEFFRIALVENASQIGDYVPIAAIAISNVGRTDLDSCCMVTLEEISGNWPKKMAKPLPLRTEGQIRGERSGRFTLSKGQSKTIPLLFRGQVRKNEWHFFDEHGEQHYVPAGPTKMVIRIFGGAEPIATLVFVDTDAGWNPFSRLDIVPKDFTLSQADQAYELISLTEAARLMYELASPSLKEMMRGQKKTGDAIEEFGKTAILVAGSQGTVRLYGRRGEGFVRELIPAEDLNDLHSSVGDVVGTLPHNADYIDVAISRADVRRAAQAFD